MSNHHDTDIFIVGVNIDKAEAFQLAKFPLKTGVYRVAHGIYFVTKKPSIESFRKIFERYCFRIAHTLFPDSGLTHSTAHNMAPIDYKIFIGGAYSYRKQIAEGYGDFSLIQSSISIQRMRRDKESVLEVLDDRLLFDVIPFEDSLGKFNMRVQTPEFMLLTQFDNIKEYKDKILPKNEISFLYDILVVKHKGIAKLVKKMKAITTRTGKVGELARFERHFNLELTPPPKKPKTIKKPKVADEVS